MYLFSFVRCPSLSDRVFLSPFLSISPSFNILSYLSLVILTVFLSVWLSFSLILSVPLFQFTLLSFFFYSYTVPLYLCVSLSLTLFLSFFLSLWFSLSFLLNILSYLSLSVPCVHNRYGRGLRCSKTSRLFSLQDMRSLVNWGEKVINDIINGREITIISFVRSRGPEQNEAVLSAQNNVVGGWENQCGMEHDAHWLGQPTPFWVLSTVDAILHSSTFGYVCFVNQMQISCVWTEWYTFLTSSVF